VTTARTCCGVIAPHQLAQPVALAGCRGTGVVHDGGNLGLWPLLLRSGVALRVPHPVLEYARAVLLTKRPWFRSDFTKRWRYGSGDGGTCPVGHGLCGINASTKPRHRSASGQAAAKASRTRLVISTARAAILNDPDAVELRRSQSGGPRDRVAHGEDQPIGGGMEDQTNLVG
jgi:hypothetical protein